MNLGKEWMRAEVLVVVLLCISIQVNSQRGGRPSTGSDEEESREDTQAHSSRHYTSGSHGNQWRGERHQVNQRPTSGNARHGTNNRRRRPYTTTTSQRHNWHGQRYPWYQQHQYRPRPTPSLLQNYLLWSAVTNQYNRPYYAAPYGYGPASSSHYINNRNWGDRAYICPRCAQNARCEYMSSRAYQPDQYQCRCQPGFDGNGLSCRAIYLHSCPSNCGFNARCVSVYFVARYEYRCQCNPGYIGDGYTCRVRGISLRNNLPSSVVSSSPGNMVPSLDEVEPAIPSTSTTHVPTASTPETPIVQRPSPQRTLTTYRIVNGTWHIIGDVAAPSSNVSTYQSNLNSCRGRCGMIGTLQQVLTPEEQIRQSQLASHSVNAGTLVAGLPGKRMSCSCESSCHQSFTCCFDYRQYCTGSTGDNSFSQDGVSEGGSIGGGSLCGQHMCLSHQYCDFSAMMCKCLPGYHSVQKLCFPIDAM